jgi:Holliday junction resolvase RusA-like endonuclease
MRAGARTVAVSIAANATPPGKRLRAESSYSSARCHTAGPVVITIAAGCPDRRRRDVDNLGKAVLDLLTAHQVIEDDAKVISITSRWDSAIPPGRITISVAVAT